MPEVAALSAIVDRKLGRKKLRPLRAAEKMAIIDSVRDGELLVSRDATWPRKMNEK